MNGRQKNILFLLHDAAEFMTAEALAAAVKYSVKTVRNDLKILRDFLQEWQLGTIVTRSNHGIRLEITQENWEKLEQLISKKEEDFIFSTKEVTQVCEILLKDQQVTLKGLESRFYVSHQGAEKLTGKAVAWLAKQGISVKRRRGQGLSIVCGEYTWRIAMWHLFQENSSISSTEEETRIYLGKFLRGFDIEGVRQAISRIERLYYLKFSYDSFQRLQFLMAVSIMRLRQGRTVAVCETEAAKGDFYSRALAEDCVAALEQWYRVRIPMEERKFLEICICISEIHVFYDETQKESCRRANRSIEALTERIVILADHIFQSHLKEDAILKETLFFYLKAAICQRRYGILQENPFVEQIKNRYPAIYAAAWSIGVLVDSEQQVEFSEHEIAYLALHLGGALERQHVRAKVCILCNYGMGISQIIKEQLQRAIGNLEIVDVFSTGDRNQIRKGSYDFIIATVPVESPYEGKEVLQIGNILQEQDIRKIREKTKDVFRKNYRIDLPELSEHAYRLFSQQFIYLMKETEEKEMMLHRLCQTLYENGYVTEGFEASVLEREKIACTALEKGVAIPHGISQCVLRPVIVFARLPRPILWDEKEEVQYIFLLALNLRKEFGAREQIIQFYSQLVSMLENEEKFRKLIEIKEPGQMAEFLNGLTKKEETNDKSEGCNCQ